MAIEINPKDPQSPSKEEINITVVRQDVQRDLTEFMQNLESELLIENREAFYSKLEKLITYKGSAVDLDSFRESFAALIAQYAISKKHNAVVPVESSSTDNVEIHNAQGVPQDPSAPDIRREETSIDFTFLASQIIENALKKEGPEIESTIGEAKKEGSKIEAITQIIKDALKREGPEIDNVSAQIFDNVKSNVEVNVDNLSQIIEAALKKEGVEVENVPLIVEDILESNLEINIDNVTSAIEEALKKRGIEVENLTQTIENIRKENIEVGISSITQILEATARREALQVSVDNIAAQIVRNAEKKDNVEALELYLYNILPYSITTTLLGVGNTVNKIAQGRIGVGDALSAGLNAWDLFNKRKYFTPGEIARMFGTNFYTIQLLKAKGITIKDMSFPGGTPFTSNTVYIREYRDEDGLRVSYANLLKRREALLDTIPEIFSGGLETRPVKYNVPQDISRLHQEIEEIGATELLSRLKKKDYEIDVSKSWSFDENQYKQFEYKKPDGTFENDLSKLLKNKTSVWQIGSIYVWPVDDQIAKPSWIPFEFNPQLSESSRTARYAATQILSRMGDLQSFTGTDSLTLSFTTQYFPVSRTGIENEDAAQHSHIDGWITAFDLRTVQMIELAYRSLVMPHFTPAEEPTETGYQFMKPPLLKIIIGDKDKVQTAPDITQNQPFSNLLTYPYPILKDQHLASELKREIKYRHFRTFVATGVEIRKDLNNAPLELSSDETPYLLDTHGFEVAMTLVEVTPNYMDAVPSFGDYYEEVRQVAYNLKFSFRR